MSEQTEQVEQTEATGANLKPLLDEEAWKAQSEELQAFHDSVANVPKTGVESTGNVEETPSE